MLQQRRAARMEQWLKEVMARKMVELSCKVPGWLRLYVQTNIMIRMIPDV